MGTSQSKLPRMQKIDLEIQVDQIYQHLSLARDRKIGDLAKKEIALREKMSERLYSYDDIVLDMMAIVSLYKYIVAVKTIMRYCKIVKGYSIRISEAQNRNNFEQISDIQPYIEGIIWSTNKLNIKYLQGFNKMIYNYFGPEVYNKIQQFTMVDYELRNCFNTIEPSPTEIKEYLDKFLTRYGLKLKDYSPMEDYDPKGGNGGGQVNNMNQNQNQQDTFDNQLNGLKLDPVPVPQNNAQQNLGPQQSNPYNKNSAYQPYQINDNFQNQNPYQQQNQQQDIPLNPPYNPPQDNTYNPPQDNNYNPTQNNLNYQYPSIDEQPKQDNFMSVDNNFQKQPPKKRDSAMDQNSQFKTVELIPEQNEKKQDIDQIIGQYIKKEDLNYDATKYYIQSIMGKDNEYEPKWSNQGNGNQ